MEMPMASQLPAEAVPETTLPLSPVRLIAGDTVAPQPGIALCLSGGGYRAMLFHLGALKRLNELKYLKRIARISSVSGGSITAGALAMNWGKLQFDANGKATNFVEMVEKPVIEQAGHTMDAFAVLRGLATLGLAGSQTGYYYSKFLFGKTTLQDLPDEPVFIFNSTSMQTGVLWRFSKQYMGDYRIGLIRNPTVPLSVAVAASSAFPPFLSPVKLNLSNLKFDMTTASDLCKAPYTQEARLTDGGVYDNLGLEVAWKRFDTILVSDACAHSAPVPDPSMNWALQFYRTLMLFDSQVGALRKRQVIDSFTQNQRKGSYWGIGSELASYNCDDALPCPLEDTIKIAAYPTRLAKVAEVDSNRLINWGYAACDAAMRKYVCPSEGAPSGFPKPGGVG